MRSRGDELLRPRAYGAHPPAHFRARVAPMQAKGVIARNRRQARHEEKKKDERSDGQRARSETALMTTGYYYPICQHANDHQ